VVGVLNAVYEEDFCGFSYGFRPGRSPHDALAALAVGITERKVNWILDADISDFFSRLDHAWLEKFLEHRIADKRVLRLIQKWLAAGVVEDGGWSETLEGSPQGASVSPLLANVYLHYVFDRWVRQWRKKHARGDMIVVRFADDFVVGFQHLGDARQFLTDLRERFAKFNLELHPDKTRLIEFGRFAEADRRERGLGRPDTFDFLGFTYLCGKTRDGRFWLRRVTIRKRLRGEAETGESRDSAPPAPPHPRAGALAGQCGARSSRPLRRARQHRCGVGLSRPGEMALAGGAAAPKPASPHDLAALRPHR
jgi:group II intron reverse transcriptase/maturase